MEVFVYAFFEVVGGFCFLFHPRGFLFLCQAGLCKKRGESLHVLPREGGIQGPERYGKVLRQEQSFLGEVLRKEISGLDLRSRMERDEAPATSLF
jgi:hypothetical protein